MKPELQLFIKKQQQQRYAVTWTLLFCFVLFFPCLCRFIPAFVISEAAGPSSAAPLCGDVAGGSEERGSWLWNARWVCDAGDGNSSRPAQSKATGQTASSTESQSELKTEKCKQCHASWIHLSRCLAKGTHPCCCFFHVSDYSWAV